MITRESMYLLAMEFYGLKEIPGEQNNPIILGWFQDIGYSWVQDDETAWCSCFINWLAWKLGIERSGKLDARSWLKVGEEVNNPQRGDLVVFWRKSIRSWKGHVGLYIPSRFDEENVYCLGGNQSNMVKISPYPEERVLSYRSLSRLEVRK